MPESVVEASTTQGVGNPTHTLASPMPSLHVSGVQVPVSETPSGARSRLPNLSELYALPQTPSLRVEHLPMSGRLLPVPVTATVQTTTITSMVAIPAAQAGSVYTPYTGQTLPPGALLAHPL